MAKVLTYFPLTLALDDKPSGSNGSNGFGFAYYWRNHPQKAAIAAHELREARWKLPFHGIAFAIGALLTIFLLPDYGVLNNVLFGLLGGMVGSIILQLVPAFRRATNLRGEAVEIVVERLYYGLDESQMIADGVTQLRRYTGMPSDPEKRRKLLVEQLPDAYKWVRDNGSLISKAQFL